MPLTAKGEEILSNLQKEYGADKGERVLYAGKNKGTFTGIDAFADACSGIVDAVEGLNRRVDAYTARRADAGQVEVIRHQTGETRKFDTREEAERFMRREGDNNRLWKWK